MLPANGISVVTLTLFSPSRNELPSDWNLGGGVYTGLSTDLHHPSFSLELDWQSGFYYFLILIWNNRELFQSEEQGTMPLAILS